MKIKKILFIVNKNRKEVAGIIKAVQYLNLFIITNECHIIYRSK